MRMDKKKIKGSSGRATKTASSASSAHEVCLLLIMLPKALGLSRRFSPDRFRTNKTNIEYKLFFYK